jgi:tetrahydromethanopterin S-methyltransferase subunit F
MIIKSYNNDIEEEEKLNSRGRKVKFNINSKRNV